MTDSSQENSSQLKWIALIVLIIGLAAVAIVAISRDNRVVLKSNGPIPAFSISPREDPLAKPAPDLVITRVNRKSPDFVELRNNRENGEYDLSGFEISDGQGHHVCVLENGLKIPAQSSIQIFFFNPDKQTKRDQARLYRSDGKIVCDTFGIGAQDTVTVYDRSRTPVAQSAPVAN
jgi:hypothetical protein